MSEGSLPLDGSGKLTHWPAGRERRRPLLAYVAAKLDPARAYTEVELNELLNQWHTWRDPATLRRELVASGLVKRTADGSSYRLP